MHESRGVDLNSRALKKSGYKCWAELSEESYDDPELNEQLKKTGVYVIISDRSFRRLHGETDILYIGQSGGSSRGKGRHMIDRLSDYLYPTASAPQDMRIHNSMKTLRERENATLFALYKQLSRNRCSAEEKELLRRFEEEHIELPPWNRQG